MPRTGSGVGEVINSEVVGLDQLDDSLGDMDRVAWRADLVGHDAQRFAFTSQAQHGFDKVSPLAATA